MHSNYASVNEQAGLFAGDKGYQVDITNHTSLIGGLATSTITAEQEHKNRFSTGTLSSQNIENYANYKANSLGLNGSVSINADLGLKNGQAQSTKQATDKDGNPIYIDNEGQETTLSKNANGTENTPKLADGLASLEVNGGLGYGIDSDSQNSVTKSGINTENLIITNVKAQQALTGETEAQLKTKLHTEITTESADKNSGKLDNRFDKDAVQAELDLQRDTVQQFGQSVTDAKTYATDYFGKADREAKEKAQAEYEQAKAAAQANPTAENKAREDIAEKNYKIAKEQAQKWEVGGEYRRNVDIATNVLTAALSGGTPAEMVASGASPIINNKIKELTQDNKVANVMAHAAWGAIEAAAAKGNASAGAVAAASAEIAAPMLAETLYGTSDPEKLSNEQRQTIVDLSGAVSGMASGLVSSNGNSVEISQAVKKGAEIGGNAVENNFLSSASRKRLDYLFEQYKKRTLTLKEQDELLELVRRDHQSDYLLDKALRKEILTQSEQVALDFYISEYFYETVKGKTQSGLKLSEGKSLIKAKDEFNRLYLSGNYKKPYNYPYAGTNRQKQEALNLLPNNRRNILGWRLTSDRTENENIYFDLARDQRLRDQIPKNAMEVNELLQNTLLAAASVNGKLPTEYRSRSLINSRIFESVPLNIKGNTINYSDYKTVPKEQWSSVGDKLYIIRPYNYKEFSENVTLPSYLYNPKQTRELLEQRSGKDNVISTTVVSNPRSSTTNRILNTGESIVVVNSGNGKAVKVYSTPNELGERKLLANIPYDQRGLPIFDDVSAFTTKIEKPSHYMKLDSQTRRRIEMKNATLALKKAIEKGQVSASNFTPLQLKQINSGKPQINDYTWHHNAQSAPNNMQLVPSKIHNSVLHVGEGALSEGR